MKNYLVLVLAAVLAAAMIIAQPSPADAQMPGAATAEAGKGGAVGRTDLENLAKTLEDADARKRFSTERDESKALLERKRCLKELKESLDIPDEVLMTLPSAGEIEERTRRAKEKAARRRAASQSIKDQESARPAPSVEEWDI